MATNSTAIRSSLELMLDRIQQQEDQPKDIPPALPLRPVSRARLPRPRRPLNLDFQRRNSEENGATYNWGGFESKRKMKDFTEPFHRDAGGVAASAALAIKPAQFDHVENGIEILKSSKEKSENGIHTIQKCYRGHKVRRYYKQLRRGIIALQSFVRGENERRNYQFRSKRLRAIILIQTQMRKYLEHKALKDQHAAIIGSHSDIRGCWDRRHSNEIKQAGRTGDRGQVADMKDHTQVPYCVLVDLQKQVLRTEAKVREKKEENIALKARLQEMDKKWRQQEERMKSMEEAWQDQLTDIQKCLAAAKKNPAPQIRFGRYDLTQQHHKQNSDSNTAIPRIPNGGILDLPINYPQQQVDQREDDEDDDPVEVGLEQVSHKLHPQEELNKLKLRFKAWKKNYRNKLREAKSMLKKLSNSETAKGQKNWWGRSSH